jgi:hypothetical protein
MRLKRALLGLLGVVLLGVAGFLFFTRHTAISAIEPPPASRFDRALVAKGGELPCSATATAVTPNKTARPYAGGRPLETGFGTNLCQQHYSRP